MLLFIEGWDWSATTSNYETLNKWLDVGSFTINTSNQRFVSGGNSAHGSGRSNVMQRAIGQNLAAGCHGFAFRVDSAASYKMNMLVLLDTTSNVQLGLLLNNDLTISIFRTDHATILGTTTATLTVNTWAYIEFKWKINNSIASGDVELYIDGVSVLSLAAATDTQNTANAYATHYNLSGGTPTITGSGTSEYYYDDHYLIDFTGSVNNAPLGNCRVQTLNPNGNGNSSQWVGSDGNSVNNYQQIDETNYSAADYNDGVNVGDKDTYAFSDTIASTATIFGLSVNYVALKTDVAARGIKPVIRHSGTDYDGSENTLGTSALHYQHIYETNPGTSSGWTKSDVDGAEFGVKVST